MASARNDFLETIFTSPKVLPYEGENVDHLHDEAIKGSGLQIIGDFGIIYPGYNCITYALMKAAPKTGFQEYQWCDPNKFAKYTDSLKDEEIVDKSIFNLNNYCVGDLILLGNLERDYKNPVNFRHAVFVEGQSNGLTISNKHGIFHTTIGTLAQVNTYYMMYKEKKGFNFARIYRNLDYKFKLIKLET